MSTLEFDLFEKEWLIKHICEFIADDGYIDYLRDEAWEVYEADDCEEDNIWEVAEMILHSRPEMHLLAKLDSKIWRKTQSDIKKFLLVEFEDYHKE